MISPFAGCRSSRDYLDAAERADPAGHAMHLAAVAAWGFATGISNAVEGITWGILLAVSVARIPKIWRCWMPIVRDPLWIALVGWAAWLAIGTALMPTPPEEGRSFAPARWLFTPLLVWPTLSRPWVVLVAMGGGAFVQVLGAMALSWSKRGWMQSFQVSGLSGFGQMQWQLHCAVTLCAAAVRWMPGRGRWASVPALGAALFVVERTGRRLGLLLALLSLALLFLRPLPRLRWWAWGVVAAVAVAAAGAALWSGAGARVAASWKQAQKTIAKDDPYSAACALTGLRLPLAHAAWDAGLERPLIGHGRASYRLYLKDWAARQQAATTLSSRKSVLQPLTTGVLNDAHNAYLNAFAEGGIPAALFLGTALLGIGVRLWRQSRTAALAGVALALYSAVLLGSLCQPVTTKAPGAITAVCLAISGITRGDGPHSDRRRIR
jgi:hypothetical protein